MDYAVMDFTSFTADLLFDHDLDLPDTQLPAYMSLEALNDLLETTPTANGGIPLPPSDNTEDISSTRSISRGETTATSELVPVNTQFLLESSDSNIAPNSENVGSIHLLEENNVLNEQRKSCGSYWFAMCLFLSGAGWLRRSSLEITSLTTPLTTMPSWFRFQGDMLF